MGLGVMTWGDLSAFQVQLEMVGIEQPAALKRGLELADVARAHTADQGLPDLLSLSDDATRDVVTDLAIRQQGMHQGLDRFENTLVAQVREALLPDLDDIVRDLQPKFEQLAAPLVEAAQDWGFTWRTTSDDIIDNPTPGPARQAWVNARTAWSAIGPIVNVRTSISRMFGVSPTREEAQQLAGWMADAQTYVDYSACFAAGDNWSHDGIYYVSRRPGLQEIDWFALAVGGLHLNTPAEVRLKHQLRQAELFTGRDRYEDYTVSEDDDD